MWLVSIGFVGPTDCTLCLRHPNGEEKEYGIESRGWKALAAIRHGSDESSGWITETSDSAAICELIWNYCDEDVLTTGRTK